MCISATIGLEGLRGLAISVFPIIRKAFKARKERNIYNIKGTLFLKVKKIR
jgi:hypothetical protein